MAKKYEPFIKGIEQYTLCCMAKDAGSRWSKPAKVFRVVDDAVEAINGLEARASGATINMFTGLKRDLKDDDKSQQIGFEQVIDQLNKITTRLAALEQK